MTITAAFRSSLDRQLLIIVIVGAVLALAWNIFRAVHYRRSVASGVRHPRPVVPWSYPEPTGRRVLRTSFGLLWLLDGLLQIQSGMPQGLPSQVITPSAASSPGWVQHLVSTGATIWSDHPITAATAAVWIQVGIGLFLLVAPRGHWSRAAGGVSAGWGVVVWVFGEAFGGIFGHGTSWMLGTPGAAVFYVVAGVLVALPDRTWESPRLGKGLLQGMGLFFVGMGVLQAWPGRGFWSGQPSPSATAGTLTVALKQAAAVSQPSVFASWVRSFASFQAGHGWWVNLAVVILLVGVGACFLSGNLRVIRIGVVVGAVLCLADWVLVQDFGFFGGLGTDPNSMIPLAAVFTAGYVALVRLPVRAESPTPEIVPAAAPDGAPVGAAGAPDTGGPPVTPVAAPGFLDRVTPGYALRCLLASGAAMVILLGAAPMALAATNPNADPIVTQANDGTPEVVNAPAPPFTLTDQYGHRVTLASLRGRTVVLTFLDPVCTSDCPLIAGALRMTDQVLGNQARGVDLVAVVTNSIYNTTAATAAFDRQENLNHLPNWTYLTGPAGQLETVWNAYGVEALISPAGAMIDHSDIVYIIDKNGHTREIINSDPGDGSSSSLSSFATMLSQQLQPYLHS